MLLATCCSWSRSLFCIFDGGCRLLALSCLLGRIRSPAFGYCDAMAAGDMVIGACEAFVVCGGEVAMLSPCGMQSVLACGVQDRAVQHG